MPLKEKQNKTNSCHWRKGYFPLLYFHYFISWYNHFCQCWIIKCWIFKLGDEIKTKCQEVLPAKHFHKATSTLVSLHNKNYVNWKNSLYYKDHKTSPGSQNKDSYSLQSFKKYIHKNVGSPHNLIYGKIKLNKFQLKNTSFVYFLGREKNLLKLWKELLILIRPFNFLAL